MRRVWVWRCRPFKCFCCSGSEFRSQVADYSVFRRVTNVRRQAFLGVVTMRFHAWIMLLIIFCASPLASIADEPAEPTADRIVGQMLVRNLQRQILLGQYTGMREYVLENERLHKRAQMLVRITYNPDGSKHFEIVSEEGW